MLKLSKLADYGLIIMSCLADDTSGHASARDIAIQVKVALPTVSKVLKLLVGGGLVESLRGVKGGYRLGRSASEITVVDIILALDGPIGLTECSAAAGHCSHEPICALRSNWQLVNRAVLGVLNKITLAEMCRPLPMQHPALKNIGVEALA